MGDDQPHMTRKAVQQRVFLAGELDMPVVERDRPQYQIDGQRSGPDHRASVGAAQVTAKRRLAPRQQLRNAERLDHVIVGAELEQANLFLLVRMDRQHDNRNIGPRAHPLEHFGAFDIRQIEVEYDEIGPVHGRSPKPALGILGLDHREAVKLEARAEKAPDLRFIVDDEHLSHRACPQARARPKERSAAATTASRRGRARGFPHEACRRWRR